MANSLRQRAVFDFVSHLLTLATTVYVLVSCLTTPLSNKQKKTMFRIQMDVKNWRQTFVSLTDVDFSFQSAITMYQRSLIYYRIPGGVSDKEIAKLDYSLPKDVTKRYSYLCARSLRCGKIWLYELNSGLGVIPPTQHTTRL